MANTRDQGATTMGGDAALPRKNGALVFEAPWEGRAFGLAVAMNEDGVYEWRDFRDHLATEIADAEAGGTGTTYYERWVASLETLVLEQGLVSREELDKRTAEYESGERDHDE